MSTIGLAPSLEGRRLYLPRMSDCGAEAFAAAFRSVGLDALVLPPPNARTLELGALYLNGDECLPAKVTLGDFLKVVEAPGFDPSRSAFMMPTAEGPCRFGQYGPAIRRVFRELGYADIPFLSPTCGDGYQQMGDAGPALVRTGWRALVASDLLQRLVLKTRPYEKTSGDTDVACAISLREVCQTIEHQERNPDAHLRALVAILVGLRDRFRAIPANYEKGRPLIGIQGEIFCRFEEFSNDRLIHRLEALGAQAWLADFTEWVWFCNVEQETTIAHKGRRMSPAMLRAKVRDHIQAADERALWAPFVADFAGYEDPHDIRAVLQAGAPYLPYTGASGEMALSAGKVSHLFQRGVDGILDVSPFSCMNGIVCEALYPRLSQDHGGLPIKNLYVDGTGRDLTSELEIFLELARTYQRRKRYGRPYSPLFS
jgi:predicted nucleotide-binding protein (sugar kinase/HSP70/actin superfamily)